MSQLFEVDPARVERSDRAIVAAAAALEAGGLVVFPTETVYGLACRPDDHLATARAFEAKGRPRELSLPILAPGLARAWDIGRPTLAAEALAAAFWPGPLTMILPRTSRSMPWDLGEEPSTVAVRVPDHLVTTGILDRTGPLAVTSANPSGRPPLESREALVGAFGDLVSVYLTLPEAAARPGGVASTVIDLTRASVRIVRAGPVGADDIRAALARSGARTQSVDFD